jgi:hypothetical protein
VIVLSIGVGNASSPSPVERGQDLERDAARDAEDVVFVGGQTRDVSPGIYFSLRAPATSFSFHVQ